MNQGNELEDKKEELEIKVGPNAVLDDRFVDNVCNMMNLDVTQANKFWSTKTGRAILERLDFDGLKVQDMTDLFESLREEKSRTAKAWNGSLQMPINVAGASSQTCMTNLGRARTVVPDIHWRLSNYDNAAYGIYADKAKVAFNSEEANWDAGFYRMNRRDQDHLWGYLYMNLSRTPNHFVSFSMETFSHGVVKRALYRNLYTEASAKMIGGPQGPGTNASRKDKEKLIVDMGLEFHEEEGKGPHAGLPGDDSRVRLIPQDRIMDGALDTLVDAEDRIFVSKAKSIEQLVSDFYAVWAGVQNEFKIYGPNPVWIICANFNEVDIRASLSNLGLIFDWKRSFSIRLVLFFLRFYKGMRYDSAGYSCTEGDKYRFRDYVAYSSVKWLGTTQKEEENADLPAVAPRSLMDIDQNYRVLNIPFADWRMRLAAAKQILVTRDEVQVPLGCWKDYCGWSRTRGMFLGGITDYVTNQVIGHWYNKRFLNPSPIIDYSLKLFLGCCMTLCRTKSGGSISTGIWWNWHGGEHLRSDVLLGTDGLALPYHSLEEYVEHNISAGDDKNTYYDCDQVSDSFDVIDEDRDDVPVWIIQKRGVWTLGLPERYGPIYIRKVEQVDPRSIHKLGSDTIYTKKNSAIVNEMYITSMVYFKDDAPTYKHSTLNLSAIDSNVIVSNRTAYASLLVWSVGIDQLIGLSFTGNYNISFEDTTVYEIGAYSSADGVSSAALDFSLF
jgi:hypothetical protein